MRSVSRHLSVALLGVTITAVSVMAQQTSRPVHSATFDVVAGGTKLGTENVTVNETGTGWQITSSGRLSGAIDLTTNRVDVTYTREWQPLRLAIEGSSRGATFSVTATFTDTTANLLLDQSGKRTESVHKVSPRTLVLPQNIFAPYEALAIRLSTAQPGTTFPIYLTAENEISVTLTGVSPRRMTSPQGSIDLRQCDVTFTQANGSVTPGEVWIDRDGFLARFLLPAQGIAVLRSDLSSVMMREERITHPGDEAVFIPSTGFSLAGTFSKPATASGKMPVIVLVGAGTQDRDETIAGIPVFGQLAGALADAGYAVVRYDRRGTGQSGGRTENATVQTYANDVIQVVKWLAERKDIDKNRIALVGYEAGGQVVLQAAALDKTIDAVVLLAAHGTPGRDIALETQEQELTRAGVPEQQKTERIAMQRRVLDAVATGKGWETIAPDVRRASDTPWFRSFVTFDPAAMLKKVNQPVLIVHGALDRQVLPMHADRLEQAAQARKPSSRTTTKIVLPGLNHLFMQAKTGGIDEIPTLQPKTISPELTRTLTNWLKDALPVKK